MRDAISACAAARRCAEPGALAGREGSGVACALVGREAERERKEGVHAETGLGETWGRHACVRVAGEKVTRRKGSGPSGER